ncbi:MAG: hypothetical protein WD029_04025 [Microthrixaceae bacterium]
MRLIRLITPCLCLLAVAAVACVAPTPPPGPAATKLEITTVQTICGGTIPPPGQPFCRTNPSSRNIQVSASRQIVAEGRTDSTGKLLIAVPEGQLTVLAPDAEFYEECDSPMVLARAQRTVAVTQTCSFNAP